MWFFNSPDPNASLIKELKSLQDEIKKGVAEEAKTRSTLEVLTNNISLLIGVSKDRYLLEQQQYQLNVKLKKTLEELPLKIQYAVRRPWKPGKLTIVPLGEVHMSSVDKINFKVVLPPLATPNDVVTRELTVTIAGATEVKNLSPDTVEVNDLVGPQDAEVVLVLVDIDDAGLRSAAATLTGVLADTFPPAAPGSLALQTIGEVHENPIAPPVEEPTPEVPTEPETPAPPVDEPSPETPPTTTEEE
jgi:hypothetical protein